MSCRWMILACGMVSGSRMGGSENRNPGNWRSLVSAGARTGRPPPGIYGARLNGIGPCQKSPGKISWLSLLRLESSSPRRAAYNQPRGKAMGDATVQSCDFDAPVPIQLLPEIDSGAAGWRKVVTGLTVTRVA